jgi:hypothetical protein
MILGIFLLQILTANAQKVFHSPLDIENRENVMSLYLECIDGNLVTKKACKIESIEEQSDKSFHVFLCFDEADILITSIRNIGVQVGLNYESRTSIGEIEKEYILIDLDKKNFDQITIDNNSAFTIICPIGASIFSFDDGVVKDVRYDFEYGNYIDVDYYNVVLQIRYYHLQTLKTIRGSFIKKAVLLGTTGLTGNIRDGCIGIKFLGFTGSLIFLGYDKP